MGTAELEGPVVFVAVCCKVDGCGKALDEVVSAPPTDGARWSDYVFVHLCQRHGEGAGRGNIMRWQERQRRAEKSTDRVAIGRYTQWAELQPAVDEARRTGRMTRHFV
jgi:hypothetical protein